jgi:hypothetical protein
MNVAILIWISAKVIESPANSMIIFELQITRIRSAIAVDDWLLF